MNFSERYGYKPVREIIQFESMDEPLRNGLWSLLKFHCWDYATDCSPLSGHRYISRTSNKELYFLCIELWLRYFKKPVDELNSDWEKILAELRNYFFRCNWYDVYDFIEFVANNYKDHQFRDIFITQCNRTLEEEMSAYRFIGGVITPITEKQEIEEIEQVLKRSLGPVATHIKRSLELLSDKNAPDYRNSIKESISAVESLAKQTFKNDSGTLGKLIKKLESEIKLHPALKDAFKSLYGYTSDANGIRHALMEKDTNDYHDAKFMLVTCSAFINYVKGKSQIKR